MAGTHWPGLKRKGRGKKDSSLCSWTERTKGTFARVTSAALVIFGMAEENKQKQKTMAIVYIYIATIPSSGGNFSNIYLAFRLFDIDRSHLPTRKKIGRNGERKNRHEIAGDSPSILICEATTIRSQKEGDGLGQRSARFNQLGQTKINEKRTNRITRNVFVCFTRNLHIFQSQLNVHTQRDVVDVTSKTCRRWRWRAFIFHGHLQKFKYEIIVDQTYIHSEDCVRYINIRRVVARTLLEVEKSAARRRQSAKKRKNKKKQ